MCGEIYWKISLNYVSCCNVMEIRRNCCLVLREKLNIFNHCLIFSYITINTSLLTLIDIIFFCDYFFNVLIVSHNSITTHRLHYNYFLPLELIM